MEGQVLYIHLETSPLDKRIATLGSIFTSAVAIDHLCTAMFLKRGRHGKKDPGIWKRAGDSIIAIIVVGGAEPLVRLAAVPGPSTVLRNKIVHDHVGKYLNTILGTILLNLVFPHVRHAVWSMQSCIY